MEKRKARGFGLNFALRGRRQRRERLGNDAAGIVAPTARDLPIDEKAVNRVRRSSVEDARPMLLGQLALRFRLRRSATSYPPVDDKTFGVWKLRERGAALEGKAIHYRDGSVANLGVSEDGKWMLFDLGRAFRYCSQWKLAKWCTRSATLPTRRRSTPSPCSLRTVR